MKLHNALTKKVDDFTPIKDEQVSLYTCGPTVYDHVHIGNFRTYLFEDLLRRTLRGSSFKVEHVMNITDIDDKTIKRSRQKYPDEEPAAALSKLTKEYEQIFLDDAKKLGIDFSQTKIVRATEHIDDMQTYIDQIDQQGFAYATDDGVYFDTLKYHNYDNHIHPYGILTPTALQGLATETRRTEHDEYEKHEAIDFALWKAAKDNEPSWPFSFKGQAIAGRPGWHIECSAMSTKYLGQQFDIHTGGVDLIFPHHENEIAQSRAASNEILAKFFVHGEHLLVDGQRMGKSLNNFYTVTDIKNRGLDPLALRLLFLQAHYRSQLNFTWDALEAAQSFLKSLQAWADSSLQPDVTPINGADSQRLISDVKNSLASDLNSAVALAQINEFIDKVAPTPELLLKIDGFLGLNLANRPDISDQQKELIKRRVEARQAKDWPTSDELRKNLLEQGIELSDTPAGQVWRRI